MCLSQTGWKTENERGPDKKLALIPSAGNMFYESFRVYWGRDHTCVMNIQVVSDLPLLWTRKCGQLGAGVLTNRIPFWKCDFSGVSLLRSPLYIFEGY